jgi:hypothetical protein
MRFTALNNLLLVELIGQHDVEDSLFLVDSVPWLQTTLHDPSSEFRRDYTEIGPVKNVSSKILDTEIVNFKSFSRDRQN